MKPLSKEPKIMGVVEVINPPCPNADMIRPRFSRGTMSAIMDEKAGVIKRLALETATFTRRTWMKVVQCTKRNVDRIDRAIPERIILLLPYLSTREPRGMVRRILNPPDINVIKPH